MTAFVHTINSFRKGKVMINLTQHSATADQINVGVIDLTGEDLSALKAALTFETLPTWQEILSAANKIAALGLKYARITGDESAMIGGAPFLMAPLEAALLKEGIRPYYAFSVRESAEEITQDGTVLKVNAFRHAGFIRVEG
jgi:hypothetical protein